ncbi:hypothetical protein AAC387_Pa02g0757 [Persea americana]
MAKDRATGKTLFRGLSRNGLYPFPSFNKKYPFSVSWQKLQEELWVRVSVGVRVSNSQLKENWLDSLSCPITEKWSHPGFDGEEADNVAASEYVIGIDSDISGALVVLKGDGMCFSA